MKRVKIKQYDWKKLQPDQPEYKGPVYPQQRPRAGRPQKSRLPKPVDSGLLNDPNDGFQHLRAIMREE